MNTNKLKYILYLAVFLFTILGFSQKIVKEKTALFKLLAVAEKQYQVTFTYANQTIDSIQVKPYNKRLTLNETIQYLKSNTPLSFTFLTSTNILISKKLSNLSICGNLIDIAINKPIEGAHITVLNTNIHAISNAKGNFSINGINENQVLEITHISFPTIYLNSTDFLVNGACITISLNQNIEILNEVILRNYLTSGITIKTNGTTTIDVLNSGILPGLIEPDILQKTQALPGISSVNETVSNINIRGGTNDQNLLLWDGIKMYHSGHFFGLISAFNPYLVDNVTIIKNGTNPQYNDGVSGTVIIETIDKISDKPSGGGGFNLLSADLFAQIPISKKIGFQFSARRSITDLVSTPTFEQYFKKAFQNSKITTLSVVENSKSSYDFHFNDYSFKILYDFNKNHKLRLSFLNVDNKFYFNEFLLSETITDSKTSELEQSNIATGVHINSKWSEKFKTMFQTYYTRYNVYAENFSLLNDQRLIQVNEVLETGIKLNANYKYNKNINLLSGYHFYELGITNKEDVNLPLFIRTIKKVIRNHSFYGELNYISNNNRTFINGGFRLNYIEKFGTFIAEPRIQAMHKINASFSVKTAGEFKSQNATQIIDLQEDFLGVEKSRWILADNSSIPIIQSKQASLGFHYKKNNLFIDLEGFYKFVNGVTTANQGFQNQYQFIKTSGSYTVKGIEFLINKKTSTFSTWFSYAFNKNDYHFKELSPSIFPNNLDIRHRISFGNTYNYKKMEFALGLLWRTGKPHTSPIENNPINFNSIRNSINYNSPNSERLASYFRADFSSTYKFNFNEKIKGMVGVSVLNFLNTKNILNTHYKINTENLIDVINNTSISATPNITLRASF